MLRRDRKSSSVREGSIELSRGWQSRLRSGLLGFSFATRPPEVSPLCIRWHDSKSAQRGSVDLVAAHLQGEFLEGCYRPTAFPGLLHALALPRGCPAPPGDKGSQAGVHLMAFFGSKSNSQRKTASESVSHAFFGSVPLRPALRCRTLPCSSPTLPSALSYAPTTGSEPPTPLQIGRPRPHALPVREI